MSEKKLPLRDSINQELEGNLFSNNNFNIDDIQKNLKHSLRNYQKRALFGLDYTLNNKYLLNGNRQLMFNMATGSGKTDIMAAAIIYLYKNKGFQNFIFVSNTNAVVKKTITNLINKNSDKYLFKNSIVIEGKRLKINLVDNFQSKIKQNQINIKISTIQSLSTEYYVPHENGFSKDDLLNNKVAILVDEAHHFNAETSATKKQKNISLSWEKLINEIRNTNLENIQLEFTATIDLNNPYLYEKYKNKIIIKYGLSEFIKDGYAKKVFKLETGSSDKDKMLNAVLISEFRKNIAKDNGIKDFKPVILFKSNNIKNSKINSAIFNDLIQNLTIKKIENFICNFSSNNSELMSDAYDYLKKYNHINLLNEIKRDFKRQNCINVNNEDIGKDENFNKINSLESLDNPIRTVFAVAKLNEGWDVLNLYDIVRLKENSSTINSTNQEAQLVGRGARYNPLMKNGQMTSSRNFDNMNSNIKYLERLYYHTSNDSKYLSNLKKSFIKMDLPVNDDNNFITYYANLKKDFKNSNFYKNGYLYQNKTRKTNANEFINFGSYGINPKAEYKLDLKFNESEYNEDTGFSKSESNFVTIVSSPKLDKKSKDIIKKGMSRNTFYRFDSLKKVIPSLNSLDEFVVDENWLGNSEINVVQNSFEPIDYELRLKFVDKFLETIQKKLIGNFKKEKGTDEFEAIRICDVISDYSKTIEKSFTNLGSQENIIPKSRDHNKIFVYDSSIVDQLEQKFIDNVTNLIVQSDIYDKFNYVYLIRNEENNQKGIKLHDFGKTIGSFAGYMPDFILITENEDIGYQLYLEPKGQQILSQDEWKENLLLKIKPENVIMLGENNSIKLYGAPFYTNISGKPTDSHGTLPFIEKTLGIKKII